MSAAAAVTGATATASRPSTTRVTVLTGRRMTDLALPASAPMRYYIDDTVAALAELLDDTPADILAGFDFSAQGRWAFARPGFPPLRLDQSLDEAGIVDGTLLTLLPVSRTERYRPVVEDVIDAIAVLDQSPEFDRTAVNQFVAVAIPVGAVALTALAALRWWQGDRGLLWPVVMCVLGVLVLLAGWAATRYYRNITLAASLLLAGAAPLTIGFALTIPPPRGTASLGPPQLAAGAAALMFLALLTRGGPRRRRAAATFLTVTAAAVTAAAIAYGFGWQRWVPAGAVLFGLFTVTGAAKLTVAIARIALPPIPAPGESVGHDELPDAVAGNEGTERQPSGWQAVVDSVPTSAVRFAERSELAKQLLAGFVASGALILTIGSVAVVQTGHFLVPSLVVAMLLTLTCGFRARLHAQPWCAWALLAAATAIPLGVVAQLSHWYPSGAWLMLIGYLAVALVALAALAATRGIRRMTPVTRRVLELADGAVVAAIVPMLLWITSVYDIVRNVRL